MFRIGLLKETSNEKIKIGFVNQECFEVGKGIVDSFETLSFLIEAEIAKSKYQFSFELNCRPERLMELPLNQNINISNYIFGGETFLNIKGYNGITPTIDIFAIRHIDENILITIKFDAISPISYETYCGIINFKFNLKDYINL